MGIFLAFFVVVSLVCLILLVKIKLKQRRSQVMPPSSPCPWVPAALPAPSGLEIAKTEKLEQSSQRRVFSVLKGPVLQRPSVRGVASPGIFPKTCLNVHVEPRAWIWAPAAAVSPGSLVEMQGLRPRLGPAESTSLSR